jgi:hypothetical protein
VPVILALAGGMFALVVLIFRPHLDATEKGVMGMSGLIRRHSPRGDAEADETDEEGASRLDEAMTSYSLFRSSESDTESTDATERDAGTAIPRIGSYDELGQTIATVLRTAQSEATQLLAAAQAEAHVIRETAEREANDVRERLNAEMAERRSQVVQIQEEADRYADESRREADRAADQIRADAEAEARQRREEGDAAKRRLEEEGRARRQELVEASRTVEARLRGALTACREVVAQLEELVGEQPAELEGVLLQEVQEVAGEVEREKA